jgi:hypothetical protein
MNSGLITALAAISGSLVGALSSAVSTSIVQKHQDRRDLVGKKKRSSGARPFTLISSRRARAFWSTPSSTMSVILRN